MEAIKRTLGKAGPEVPAIGLGCMVLSGTYGPAEEKESLATLDRALELGCNFWDTADVYGRGHNEELVGRALKGRSERVVLATKCGFVWTDTKDEARIDGSPQHIRAACEASLRRLGVDVIDLYYLHRLDPKVPIEESVGAMAELVRSGQVRHIGLSEVSANTLRRAAKVHPIAALQSEYSLWTRDPEGAIFQACRELGVCFVAFSPVGRALAERIRGGAQVGATDPAVFEELEQMRQEMAELNERVDFTERLLSKAREAGQLGAGSE